MSRHALAIALAALSAGAFAATETYNLDPAHTAPYFSYNHLGYSTQQHRFEKVSGQILLDREARTGSVDVTIDATSVDTGFDLFDEHIQAADFLDTANHPTITFKSTAVRIEGDRPVAVDGNLTIKGVTKPVTLAVTSFQAMPHPMLKRDAIGANATTKVKRSDFNMGKNAPYVSDEVTLTLAVEAVKE